MKKFLLLIVVAAVAVSCNAVETRTNDKADIENGRKVAEAFLTERKNKNFEKAMEFTQISKNNTAYQEHFTMLKTTSENFGDIVSFKPDTALSNIAQEGNHMEGNFTIKYKVQYQRASTTETYMLAYHENEIKVMTYMITNE